MPPSPPPYPLLDPGAAPPPPSSWLELGIAPPATFSPAGARRRPAPHLLPGWLMAPPRPPPSSRLAPGAAPCFHPPSPPPPASTVPPATVRPLLPATAAPPPSFAGGPTSLPCYTVKVARETSSLAQPMWPGTLTTAMPLRLDYRRCPTPRCLPWRPFTAATLGRSTTQRRAVKRRSSTTIRNSDFHGVFLEVQFFQCCSKNKMPK
ncbi:extensin isoform X1 [Triticum aestivum]|uniref:extensin isoform X1 n=1 Tax=Triticum aestivum TaxID=4565 RepID=UPI00098A8485|nr:extensin isoform X1 [Aegilops tauschii subsp. strangulata]XP_044331976.1 extensin-like isoform X1 [Triticum aestivum]